MHGSSKLCGTEDHDIVTDVCDALHGAFVKMMRDAKNRGRTFDQFMASLCSKPLPEEVMNNLRNFWNSH